MKTLREIFTNVCLGADAEFDRADLIHAATDLLPNLKQFISTWGI